MRQEDALKVPMNDAVIMKVLDAGQKRVDDFCSVPLRKLSLLHYSFEELPSDSELE